MNTSLISRLSRYSARSPASLRHMALLGFTLGLGACGGSQQPIGQNTDPITDSSDSSSEESDESGAAEACAGGIAVSTDGGDCQVVARGVCFATAEAACACAGCGLDACALAETFPAQAFCQDDDGPDLDNPDEPVSDDGSGSSGSAGCGEPGGGSDPSPGAGAAACGAGAPRGDDPDARCDFIVHELCFDAAEVACACAGCAADECVVLESYPAQIACAPLGE